MRVLPRSWAGRCASSALILVFCGLCLVISSRSPESSGCEFDPVPVKGVNGAVVKADAASSVGRSRYLEDGGWVPLALFSLLDGYSDYEANALPDRFSEEVLGPDDLEGCVSCHCSDGVVGMVFEGNSADTLDAAASVLEGRGWRIADKGASGGGMTFLKGSGRYRWVYLACSQVSDSVSLWAAYLTEGS